jgi:hypothetical protein
MPYVELCSPTNSTMFTTCCGCAILSRERDCPDCGEPIYPYYDKDEPQKSPNDVNNSRWAYAFRKTR